MFGEDSRPEDEASYDLTHALDGNRAYDSADPGLELPDQRAVGGGGPERSSGGSAHWNANALANAQLLTRRLRELPGVTPPEVPEDRVPAFHKYRVQLDATKARRRRTGRRWSGTRCCARCAPRAARSCSGRPARARADPLPAPRRRGGPAPGRATRVRYDLAQFPETLRILDRSLCLFSQTYPIAAQPPPLVEAYADAFARVWMRLGEVLALPRGP